MPRLKHLALMFLAGMMLNATAFAVEYELETVATDLDQPWSVAMLPDASFLVTLRPGGLVHISPEGEQTAISGGPDTFYAGQGGYFDVVLHPDYAENGWLYLSYAHGDAEGNGTAIIRARLEDNRLVDMEQILLVSPLKDTPQHYGGRMAFKRDNTLLVTTGDGFEYREAAQDTNSELGKVLRITDSGATPDDNPFPNAGKGRVFTYGHRNPQGLVIQARTGDIYMHEHGPRGGDEVNHLIRGANYGWPMISYGLDYSGAYVSPFTEAPGVALPRMYWSPSIAPSGMAFYNGDLFPEWKGQMFIGALVDQDVRRLVLEDGQLIEEERLFRELEQRIRDVRDLGDGYLYLLTDSATGSLIRVRPASRAQ